MKDPHRLVDDPRCPALDRAALRSAANDAPSDEARCAVGVVLGIRAANRLIPAYGAGQAHLARSLSPALRG